MLSECFVLPPKKNSMPGMYLDIPQSDWPVMPPMLILALLFPELRNCRGGLISSKRAASAARLNLMPLHHSIYQCSACPKRVSVCVFHPCRMQSVFFGLPNKKSPTTCVNLQKLEPPPEKLKLSFVPCCGSPPLPCNQCCRTYCDS